MKREIKFRAWDGEKMHEVLSIIGTNFCKVPKKSYPYSKQITVEIVLQYTGFNDNDGVEIYEGDILKIFIEGSDDYPDQTFIRDVNFSDGCFNAGTVPLYAHLSESIDMFRSETQVIGNVYKNKNLAIK